MSNKRSESRLTGMCVCVRERERRKRRSGDASSNGGDGKLTIGGTVDEHIKIAVMTRCYFIIILPVSFICACIHIIYSSNNCNVYLLFCH